MPAFGRFFRDPSVNPTLPISRVEGMVNYNNFYYDYVLSGDEPVVAHPVFLRYARQLESRFISMADS